MKRIFALAPFAILLLYFPNESCTHNPLERSILEMVLSKEQNYLKTYPLVRLKIYKVLWNWEKDGEILEKARNDTKRGKRWANAMIRKEKVKEQQETIEERLRKGEKSKAEEILVKIVRGAVTEWLKDGHVNFRKNANKGVNSSKGWTKKIFKEVTEPFKSVFNTDPGEEIFKEVIRKMEEKGLIKEKKRNYMAVQGERPSKAPERVVDMLSNHITKRLLEK